MLNPVSLYRSPGNVAPSEHIKVKAPGIGKEAEELALAKRPLAVADTREPMTIEVRTLDSAPILDLLMVDLADFAGSRTRRAIYLNS